jgi:hypothetical protein
MENTEAFIDDVEEWIKLRAKRADFSKINEKPEAPKGASVVPPMAAGHRYSALACTARQNARGRFHPSGHEPGIAICGKLKS